MASNTGKNVRVIFLLCILALVAAGAWYRFMGPGASAGGGNNIELTVANGDLLGKTIEDASAALGAQPVEQPNPDGEKSTARIYLYTLASDRPDRRLVRVRAASNGKIIATNFVDEAGNVINVESDH